MSVSNPCKNIIGNELHYLMSQAVFSLWGNIEFLAVFARFPTQIISPRASGHNFLQQVTKPSWVYWPMEVSRRKRGIPQNKANATYGTRKAPSQKEIKQHLVSKWSINTLIPKYSRLFDAGKKNTISSVYLPRFCSRERGTSTHCLGPPHSQLRQGGILSYLPIGLCLHHLPASLLSSFVWTFQPQRQFTVKCVYTRLSASFTCDPSTNIYLATIFVNF